ncbi:AMP-binding protein [Actinocorallia sp. API 0066]|uniref:AMP-binding protein n=1 Tax=Actinocorallia sp. API 0066 TaxID=2896846 RepID=UPI001E37DD7B|nr:AMP-binding protein [Actinocorallia sp. API 0066]MCD0448217.1 AMP-binding protein [Actinocorallia sp. API 0066]
MSTVTALLAARSADDAPGLTFEGRTWTWHELVGECAARAHWLRGLRAAEPGRPAHLGVLLDNVPEMLFLLGGAALSGTVLVALNTTRTPDRLAADARRADCDLILTEPAHLAAAREAGEGAGLDVIDYEDPAYAALLSPHKGEPFPDVAAEPGTLLMLIFTSGTSGDPRAVRITHRKIAVPGENLAGRLVNRADVVYSPMPLFHSGAIMAAVAPALAAGAHLVLRRRFSASGLLPDLRAHGATYMHYVGKALSYALIATPEKVDNPLRIAFGNEAAPAEQAAFGEKYGCLVIDAYGSTETAISFSPDPFGPPGALGKLTEGVAILDPATGEPCPPGVTGELVATSDNGLFDGYYRDAAPDRTREGMFWSGDHAYADENGYVFFVGRSLDRLRVDGENFGAAEVERALGADLPGPFAVYGVPDTAAGDQVMLAVTGAFDPEAFGALAGRLNPKWMPRFVRVCREFPLTASNKILKRTLAARAWLTDDPVWYRPGRAPAYRPLTPDDVTALHADLVRTGRTHLLEGR